MWGKDHKIFMLIMTWHMQRVGKHISTVVGKRVTQWFYWTWFFSWRALVITNLVSTIMSILTCCTMVNESSYHVNGHFNHKINQLCWHVRWKLQICSDIIYIQCIFNSKKIIPSKFTMFMTKRILIIYFYNMCMKPFLKLFIISNAICNNTCEIHI